MLPVLRFLACISSPAVAVATQVAAIVALQLPVLALPAQAGTANLLLNGDFENNTVVSCQSNIGNGSLSLYLPTAVGFGTANEIDVYRSACYGLAAISGTTKVAMVCQSGGTSDALSLALSSPVHTGDLLDLAFAAQAVLDFTPNLGAVEVGLSSAPTVFGSLVYTGSVSQSGAWQWFGASFTAPQDAGYLTVRVINNGSWVHVDAFTLTSGSATLFCSGDGSGSPCPCANGTAPSRGCANSGFAAGARLLRSGVAGASNATDSLTLRTSEITGPGIFVQGTGLEVGGGFPFGDGLRCITGTITYLGVVFPAGGIASLPNGGSTTPLHTAGAVTAGDVRHYQMWYRDALPYCAAETFNLTEGITVTWGN